MLVAAALCPHPPILVPQIAAGLANELDGCRDACAKSIDEMMGAEPELLVVFGAGKRTQEHPVGARGSLRPYGLDMALGVGTAEETLPLSLGIGAWLLGKEQCPRVAFQGIAATTDSTAAAAVGAEWGAKAARVAALVMSDGSAYPSQTPVGDDGRGERYDDRWTQALEQVDTETLLALDPADDGPLWTTGRPALQALAGAILAAGGMWHSRIDWRGAPYGVGYVVASLIRS